MATYIVRARHDHVEDRNSSGVNGYLVDAADAAAARTAAEAVVPDGESKVKDAWEATVLTLPAMVEGNVLLAGERRRGR